MNYFSSLRLKKDPMPVLLERIEGIIWSKMKLALETECQSTETPNQAETFQISSRMTTRKGAGPPLELTGIF